MSARAETDAAPCCEECGRRWHDQSERWAAEWVDDKLGVRFWCLDCWAREFKTD